MAARAPLRVQIPTPEADKPSWLRVGVVALIGFAVGVAWPKFAGVRLGPSAPAEAASAAATGEPTHAPVASVVAAVTASAPPVVSAAPAPPTPAAPTVSVSKGSVVSCKNDAGESIKGKDCGRVTGFDSIAQRRIGKIALSPTALGNEGKLSVNVTLDFTTNRVTFVDVGKSSTVKSPDAFKSLLSAQFQGVSLGTVDHVEPRVTLNYAVTLAPPSGAATTPAATSASSPSSAPPSTATPATPTATADDGTATIVWDVAIVRDSPHTGAVVGRLPRGTKVKLGDAQGGWYKVEFGSGFSSQGFLYRGAVGK